MRSVAWPEPCWSCWFAETGTGRGNVTRVKGLTALAEAADTDPAATTALETRAGQPVYFSDPSAIYRLAL